MPLQTKMRHSDSNGIYGYRSSFSGQPGPLVLHRSETSLVAGDDRSSVDLSQQPTTVPVSVDDNMATCSITPADATVLITKPSVSGIVPNGNDISMQTFNTFYDDKGATFMEQPKRRVSVISTTAFAHNAPPQTVDSKWNDSTTGEIKSDVSEKTNISAEVSLVIVMNAQTPCSKKSS